MLHIYAPRVAMVYREKKFATAIAASFKLRKKERRKEGKKEIIIIGEQW